MVDCPSRRRHPYGAALLLLEDARGLMRRAREARVPDVPISVDRLRQLLAEPCEE